MAWKRPLEKNLSVNRASCSWWNENDEKCLKEQCECGGLLDETLQQLF